MKYKRYLLLLALLFINNINSASTSSGNFVNDFCISSYHELEMSLKSNLLNIESIDNGFFPLNDNPPLWMTVNVYYNTSTVNHDVITSFPNAIGGNSLNATPDYVFQWLDSAIMMYVDPRMISLMSGVSLPDEKINIMIDPLCSEDLRLLSKLIAKLQQFTSIPVQTYSHQGYSAFISGNKRIILQTSRRGFSVLQALIICFATLVHYSLAFMLMIIPSMTNELNILPVKGNLSRNAKINWIDKSVYRGIAVSTTYFLFMSCVFNVIELTIFSPNSVWWLVLPFPIPLLFFFLLDLYVTYKGLAFQHSNCNSFTSFCLFLSVVIFTLFLQYLSFHSVWFTLLLITYPLKIGIWFCMKVTMYIGGAFLSSIGLKVGINRHCIKSMIVGHLFMVISLFMLTYFITMAIYPHHDGIAVLMPSLFPFIVVGFYSWTMKNVFVNVSTHDKYFLLSNDDIEMQHIHDTEKLSDNED